MLTHAYGEKLSHGVSSIGHLGKLLVSNQTLKDALFVLKSVIVHSSLCGDEVGNCLRMLTRDDRMVEHEIVERL